MEDKEIEKLNQIFNFYPEIKLVYFFGSKANNNAGPLSDYDLAFYFDEKDERKIFKIKFELQDKISRALGTNKVDVVILNTTESPELKYSIIKDGKLIFEQEPHRLLIEPRILTEYFDFHALLQRHGLTRT